MFSKFQKIINARKSKYAPIFFLNSGVASVLLKVFALTCILFPCFFVCLNIGFADSPAKEVM